jgi:hypothetical protein
MVRGDTYHGGHFMVRFVTNRGIFLMVLDMVRGDTYHGGHEPWLTAIKKS